MGKKKHEIELLAPAGSFEKEQFAFAYGADAVYAGIPMFSLRARENRFVIDEVAKAVEYARKLKKKIYLTANIYAHNIKIEPFMKAMEMMVKLEPDGFIMADPGLIMLVKEKFPKAIIHLSTQANNVNWAQAQFWHKYLGVERIVLARELSIKEIKEIHEKVPEIEIEAFIHGAICISYSGRCLMSNYFTGRDSNQGLCAQSCRWQYKVYKEREEQGEYIRENYNIQHQGQYYIEEKERPGEFLPFDEDEYGTYIMNSRDMCSIYYLKDLIDAGVMSLKIEGRSKTLHYLAKTVQTYRRALDLIQEGNEIPENYLDELASVSNRGFIPGFYVGNLQEQAQEYKGISYQTHQFLGIVRNFDNKKMEAEIEVKNRINKGDEIEFILPDGSFSQVAKDMWYEDDEENELLDGAAGGHKNIILKTEKPLSDFALVRKKL